MELSKNDLIKFYELRKHQDDLSPNVGIVGSRKEFNLKVKEILETTDHDLVHITNDGQQISIFNGDIEVCYINIQSLDDLQGKYFRKYM